MRHLGLVGRVPLYRVDTQPLRYIHRQIFRHHQTVAVFEEKEVEKTRVAHDTGRLAGLAGHNVRSAFRMVRTTAFTILLHELRTNHEYD